MRHTALFAALLLIVGCASAHGFSLARGNREFEPTLFATDRPNCELNHQGIGFCRSAGQRLAVALPVDGDRLQLLYSQALGTSILFVYQYGTVETGACRVALVRTSSPSPVWTRDLYGFNLGPPLVTSDAVYVTTSDIIGKVALPTGALLWHHTDLHQVHGRFESFGPIHRIGQHVTFTEREPQAFEHQGVWHVVVDDTTGAILYVGGREGV